MTDTITAATTTNSATSDWSTYQVVDNTGQLINYILASRKYVIVCITINNSTTNSAASNYHTFGTTVDNSQTIYEQVRSRQYAVLYAAHVVCIAVCRR